MTRAYQLAAVATLVVGLAAAATRPGNLPTSGRVVKVYDGDTLTIESGGKTFNVRLAGIDTPERSYTKTLNAMERMADFAPLARRRELSAGMKPFRVHATRLEVQAKDARKALAGLVEGKTVFCWPTTPGSRHGTATSGSWRSCRSVTWTSATR